ncbi:MAG: hypothetical protein ACYDDO_04725 [Acidiferrobacterales bacterium]
MRPITILLAMAILLPSLLPKTVQAAPSQRHVILRKYTTLTADIVPGLGTRFIFPFVLDEQDRYVPFTLDITNPTVFVSHRDPGRNSFVVTTPVNLRRARYYGNLYVTVAGYEISVELRTTTDRARDASDIIFDLGRKARADLIQQAVARHMRALDADYQRKVAELDKRIDEQAIARIGTLALHSPEHHRIEEEARLKLANGNRVVLYVDESLTFGAYTVFTFDVHSGSHAQGISVTDARVFEIEPGSSAPTPIEAADMLPARIPPGGDGQGTVTVVGATLNPANLLRLDVLTDQGKLEAQW